MSASPADLRRECVVFTRLIAGSPPSDYLLAKYVAAHRETTKFEERSRFDRWALRMARLTPLSTRLGDGYARHFAPDALLRRKLVLVLGLIEIMPLYSERVDAAPRSSLVSTLTTLFMSGLTGTLVVVLGVLVYGPVHLCSGLRRHDP